MKEEEKRLVEQVKKRILDRVQERDLATMGSVDVMEHVLLTGSNARKGIRYERQKTVTAWLCYAYHNGGAPHTDEEKRRAAILFEEGIRNMVKELATLPPAILEGEALEKVCLGFISRPAYLRLAAYYLNEIAALRLQ